jgi:hypothetical protein
MKVWNPFDWAFVYRNAKSLFVTLIFFIYLLYKNRIDDRLNEIIKDYGFDKIELTSLITTLLFLFSIYCFAFVSFNYKKFKVSKPLTWMVFYFSVIVFVNKTLIDFTGFMYQNSPIGLKSIFYILFPYLPLTLLLFKNYLDFLLSEKLVLDRGEIGIIDYKTQFVEDKPISSYEDDNNMLSEYAKLIATKILNTKTETSFGIGVNSEWGTGKTTFMNFIKGYILKENCENVIVVDFNAWLAERSDLIAKDFLSHLGEKLAPYHIGIQSSVENYINALFKIDESTIGKLISFFISFFVDDQRKSMSGTYITLKKRIESIDKKIVVFLDDIDRLDKREVMEVLRLVRNIANFPNTFFVIGYDRKYIASAIKDINEHDSEKYIDKIIQYEISLPSYKPDVIRDKFIKLFDHENRLAPIGQNFDSFKF